MKKVLLHLYTNVHPKHVISLIRELLKEAHSKSIDEKSYQDPVLEIDKLNKKIISGIRGKSRLSVLSSINDMRTVYQSWGNEPTPTDSGVFHMLYLLDEITEFLMIVATEKNGWRV